MPLIPDRADGLLGLASGVQGFLKGMQDAEDRNYKRMEFDAKMKAQQTEEQRKRFNDILEIRAKGLIPTSAPADGDYTKTDPSTYQWDPNSPAMLQAKKPTGSLLYGPDRLNLQRDNQTAAAVDKIANDAQLKQHAQRIQGADRITSQLAEIKSGKIVDTNQFLNDLNAEYVNLLTGSNNAALGKLQRTEYQTMAGNLANIIQQIKGEPKSINSPKILEQLEKSVLSLRENYVKNLKERGALLQRTYKHNPDATAAQQAKVQEMIGQYEAPQGLLHGGNSEQEAAERARLEQLRQKAAGG